MNHPPLHTTSMVTKALPATPQCMLLLQARSTALTSRRLEGLPPGSVGQPATPSWLAGSNKR